MNNVYNFIKRSIQSEEGVKDLISTNYINWALTIIRNEKLQVSDTVLDYLNREATR